MGINCKADSPGDIVESDVVVWSQLKLRGTNENLDKLQSTDEEILDFEDIITEVVNSCNHADEPQIYKYTYCIVWAKLYISQNNSNLQMYYIIKLVMYYQIYYVRIGLRTFFS